ncbi:MAG: AAA family ATPase, partial [Acidilobaceae archaeon]
MIIREVTIENILSHERSHIEFTRGVNVIVGPNGSGKSAIIDSIILALLAPCSGYGEEVVRASLDNIVRIGSTGGRVKVKIEVGGFAYTIERLIERRGSGEPKIALYDSNNRPIARGTREFCAKIESLLGLRDPHKVLLST